MSQGFLIYNMVATVNKTVLHTWKFLRIDLKSLHHKKKIYARWQMSTGYAGDPITVHTSVESLYCTPETCNIILVCQL